MKRLPLTAALLDPYAAITPWPEGGGKIIRGGYWRIGPRDAFVTSISPLGLFLRSARRKGLEAGSRGTYGLRVVRVRKEGRFL